MTAVRFGSTFRRILRTFPVRWPMQLFFAAFGFFIGFFRKKLRMPWWLMLVAPILALIGGVYTDLVVADAVIPNEFLMLFTGTTLHGTLFFSIGEFLGLLSDFLAQRLKKCK